ncbi:MAG: hypothetical protein S4CHLAM45_01320 [Chlamydiales bacterium]|nr:hypothetical protein [Chlamydiales bacterium]MCH9619452.1 hypothetical protein [Chlamydiales bacterium]MCH9622256.1 hypothetical protein [Chlamydiales bacterium]
MIVHTVQLEKPKPITQKQPPPPQPVAKKPVAKKVTPKKPAVKKEVAREKKTDNSQLLAMMEESLQGLEQTKTPKTTSVSAPDKIGTLKSEVWTEVSYQQMLVSYLQDRLHFPEKGEVRVKFLVNRNGSIATLTVVKASSAMNKNYVSQKLENLSLPHFGSSFKGEKTHSFSVTLTSN